jgi:hypothetical protein
VSHRIPAHPPLVRSAGLLAAGLLAMSLTAGDAPAGPSARQPAWTVVAQPDRPDDLTVAAWRVQDFGARGDGVTDDTAAFQAGLTAVAAIGGGALYAPAGRYAIRGTLTIPTGVTLVGEWRAPSAAQGVRGTVLMAYAGRGEESGPPFIGLAFCSGVRDLAIWHPEQRADAIVPYPFALKQLGSDNATIENVTLVNPYQGIQVGPEWNELHYLHNVYGSPLALGFEFDFTTDIGRIENLQFSPACWAQSGLPGAPPAGGAHAQWMRAHGTGVRMLRSDWEYAAGMAISGYRVGFEIAGSKTGFPNAQFLRLAVSDCDTALLVQNAAPYGVAFTACSFRGSRAGVETSERFDATLQFLDCGLAGGERALRAAGAGTTLFQHCRFDGAAEIAAGAVAILDSDLGSAPVQLGPGVAAASIAGNRSTAAVPVVDRSGDPFVTIDPAPLGLRQAPALGTTDARPSRAATSTLFVATAPRWGAKRDGKSDDTAAIQGALDAAAAAGGGIVFLPGGEYALRGHLRVPGGVELRGVYEVPHHTMGRGSTLLAFADHGQAEGEPFIALAAHAGLRGLTIHHPEQDNDPPVPYPWTIQGRGEGVWVVDVAAVNPWRLLDLADARCDHHYVDYLAGSPFDIGVRVGGGSRDGCVRNLQLNPHYFHRAPFAKRPLPSATKKHDPVWEWQKAHLDALVVGACRDELLFQNFVFGSLYGIHLVAEHGDGPAGLCIGHGTDGSKVAARIDALAAPGMDFVNAELVCIAAEDKVAIRCGDQLAGEARFFNTLVWGNPDAVAVVEGGALLLSLANLCDYGDGFAVRRGALAVAGAHFRHGRAVLAGLDSGATAAFTGNVLAKGLTVKAGVRLQAVPSERHDTQREAGLPPGMDEIGVVLDRQQRKRGVALRERDGESVQEAQQRAGRWGWACSPASKARYMYFALAYAEFQGGGTPRQRLAIDYFDEGSGSVEVVYDAAGGPWKSAGRFALTGSGTWKRWQAEIADAGFSGRCNGADLRLNLPAQPPVIGALTLTRMP